MFKGPIIFQVNGNNCLNKDRGPSAKAFLIMLLMYAVNLGTWGQHCFKPYF